MIVGYVSNERYVALADVSFEFRGADAVTCVRSTVSGTVYADLPPGDYEVVLGKDGYGSKIVQMTVTENRPHHFRLLSDGLLGYMWPKCAKAGDTSEFRVHAVVEYELEALRSGTPLRPWDFEPDAGVYHFTVSSTAGLDMPERIFLEVKP